MTFSLHAFSTSDTAFDVQAAALEDVRPHPTEAALVQLGHAIMTEAHITRLEKLLDRLNAQLPPLKDFVLPGGSRAAGCAHVARAVCRRAERRVVTLAGKETAPPLAMRYLNRLSDLLFVLARVFNRRTRGGDVLWQQGKNR